MQILDFSDSHRRTGNNIPAISPASPITGDLLFKLLDASASSIVVTDARRKDNPIVFASRSFYATTGYTKEEVINNNCRFLQGGDVTQPNLNFLRDAIRRGKECKVILRNYRKDGSLFWNELQMSPYYENGQLLYFIGVQNDITDRIEACKEREVHNAGILHDLKTPLFGQARILEFMSRSLKAREASDTEQHALDLMLDSLKSSTDRIFDLLNQYKLENDLIVPEPTVFSSREIMEKAVALLHEKARTNRIILQTIEMHGDLEIYADQGMVLRALLNLIDNAIAHSAADRRIWIISSKQANDDMPRISVVDEGPGLPETVRDAFDSPHLSLKSGFRTRKTSTGLGLMIASQLMRYQGGRLTLQKTSERGTEFALDFAANTNLLGGLDETDNFKKAV